MKSPGRYAKLVADLAGTCRENGVHADLSHLTELEIQAHWFAGDFGTEFTTVRGDRVSIAQFGAWNREAGPDFADAALTINGGKPVRGSIEIDPEAQDWERHGHGANPDYDSVVLHVCARDSSREFFTRNSRHKEVPRILLDARTLHGPPSDALPAAKLGRCAGPLRALPDTRLREILEEAARYRLQRKAARLARLAQLHGEDEALFQALAVTLGYKGNKVPFTILSQRLPFSFLRKHKEDLEALLFGVAGFLDAADFTAFDLETRTYLRGLWDRWWKLRGRHAAIMLPPNAWRLASVRPQNHPQRRIAALAQIVRHWHKLSSLVKDGEVKSIAEFFDTLSDDYWDFHYTLTSKKSRTRMALVGPSRVNDMLANVIYPLIVTSHPERWKDYLKLPAPMANRPVKIAALRLIGVRDEGKAILRKAVHQQGLIQIYEDFCARDNSDCAQCLFPAQIVKW